MMEFVFPIRVYYEDTDCGGVVYHSNYLNFFERGRTEWLRSCGVEQDDLQRQDSIFVVSDIQCRFIRPARFNQLVQVVTSLKKLGHASLILEQRLLSTTDSSLLAQAEVKIASLRFSDFKPQAFPLFVRQAITKDI